MKTKKIPMRMCLGCNEMKSKRDMIRVVKAPSGEVSLDFTGKNPEEARMSVKISNASVKPERQGVLKSRYPA